MKAFIGLSLCLTAAPFPWLFGLAEDGMIELYVSSEGNDSWSGRGQELRAPDGPFATLVRAREELRKLKAAGQLSNGAVVNVLPGTYDLSETFVLGPEDSGSEGAPIVYRGLGAEKPMLKGGKILGNFQPYRGEILQCNLGSNDMKGTKFHQLFFRGKRQTLARYPNPDYDDPHGGKWAHVAAVEGKENHKDFMYGPDESHHWEHPEDGEVSIFAGYDWAFRIVPIAEHLPEQRKIVLDGSTWGALTVGDRYAIHGLFEELDSPGEWYLDPRSETLYFWPPDKMGEGDVVAPVLDTLVSIQNTEYIIFQGFILSFAQTETM